jgi:hypothetical protein
LYAIQQQQQQIKTTTKLIQKFPQEHSSHCITSLLQINPNTLVSSSWSDSPSDNVIVIWSKSPKSSSLLYEPIQRITREEIGGINRLVLINQKKEEEEEEFASCSYFDKSIIIWRRVKGDKEMFKIKQKIENVTGVDRLLYISLTNELIFGSYSLLQIWSPSSSSSSCSDFKERQKIEISSSIWSLCQINKNDTNRIEFASGHRNGKICIWSKQQQIANESNHYSLLKTLKPFNDHPVEDLIFINDNGLFDCLISCCGDENKIVIYKGEEEEEVLEHKEVKRLIPMSNGQFASGGHNGHLNIWSP